MAVTTATASPATATWPSQLDAAIGRLPERGRTTPSAAAKPKPAPAFTPPPPERHIAEGSFFIGDDRTIHQVEGGQGVPVVYGGTLLKANGTMTGKRLAALVGLRDLARRVLPIAERRLARCATAPTPAGH